MQRLRGTDKIYLAYIIFKSSNFCNIYKSRYKYIHVMERETTIVLCAYLSFSPFFSLVNIWYFLPLERGSDKIM